MIPCHAAYSSKRTAKFIAKIHHVMSEAEERGLAGDEKKNAKIAAKNAIAALNELQAVFDELAEPKRERKVAEIPAASPKSGRQAKATKSNGRKAA